MSLILQAFSQIFATKLTTKKSMKNNLHYIDRVLRLLLAIMVLILYFTGLINGALAWILVPLAIIFSVTALVNFCPLYSLFGFSTLPKAK